MENERAYEAIAHAANWREREAIRCANGTYKPLPSMLRDFPRHVDHYTHLSDTRPGLLAFTASEQAGAADRQKVMTVANYIGKYFPDRYTDATIQRWTQAISPDQPFYIRYLSSTKDIVNAYARGPGFGSCMRYSEDRWVSGIHPASVYGESDLQLAVYMSKDVCPADGDFMPRYILARALVWPDRKWRGRIFSEGYNDAFAYALRDAGWSKRDDFYGAKLRRIPWRDTFIMPYLDIGENVDDIGEWFIVTDSGEYHARGTDGIIGEREDYDDENSLCNRCEERFDGDDGSWVRVDYDRSQEFWCEHCVDNHSFYCEGSHERYSHRRFECVEVNGNIYESDYASDHFNRCDYDDEYTDEDLVEVVVEYGPNNWMDARPVQTLCTEHWCETNASNHAVQCEYTDTWYSKKLAELVPVISADGDTTMIPDITLWEHDIYRDGDDFLFEDEARARGLLDEDQTERALEAAE